MASAEERLLTAAVEELTESGYRGATTRSIALRAGVNEVTLFRKFGTKAELLRKAIGRWVAPFVGAVPEPTEDLVADLTAIATGYVAFIDANPSIVARVLPEMTGEPELRDLVGAIQAPVVEALGAIIAHHQRGGSLVEDPVDDALRAFMGPLAARAVMAHLLDPEPFDAGRFVRRFLDGHRPG